MSKSVLVAALLCAFVFHSEYAYAKSAEDAEADKRAEMRKKIEEKKAELNGSSWEIQIKSQGGKGSLEGADTLTFQDGKFSSEILSKKNYAPTNYTLTTQEDGPTVWETMQTSEKDGITFWRGEWQKETMSGVITRQLEKGSEDYYFSSSAMKSIPPTSTKTEEEAQTSEISGSLPAVSDDVTSILVSKTAEPEAPKAEEPQKVKEKSSWFF